MKVRYIIPVLLFSVLGYFPVLQAQEENTSEKLEAVTQEVQQLSQQVDTYKPGKSGFLLRGYAHSGLQATKDEFSFVGGAFNPLFIYKQSDRLLFESELEFELSEGEVEIGLEYANMSYILNKFLTFRAGKFLVPFGTYVSNLHPAWINKFPGNPLGVGHGGILPTNDIGLELRGSSYLGNMKVNYSVYAVNGAQLNDGEIDPEEAGMLHYAVFPDNNKGKTAGGRLGIFPFSNSSLELGFSGMYGKAGAKGTKLEDVNALLYAFDLSFVRSLPGLKSVFDVKAQYSGVQVDDAEYPDHETPGEFNTFNNSSSTWFAQVSLRPAYAENNYLRNFELATRYSTLKTPDGSEWAADRTQLELGINYWVDWRSVLKFSYRISNSAEGEHGDPGEPVGHGEEVAGNAFLVHWSIGF